MEQVFVYKHRILDNQIICKRKGAKATAPVQQEVAPVVVAPTDAAQMAEEGPSEGEVETSTPVKAEESTSKDNKPKVKESKASPKEKEGKKVSKESKSKVKEGKKAPKEGKN